MPHSSVLIVEDSTIARMYDNSSEDGIDRAVVETPIGPVLVEAKKTTLLGIRFQNGKATEGVENLPSGPVDPHTLTVRYSSKHVENEVLSDAVAWIRAYFGGTETKKPSVVPVKDDFTSMCWLTAMQKVPFGQTMSYGELAAACGKTSAHSRAVGGAMKKNPYLLLVPCHRIVRSGGEIGEYSAGGPRIKKWLLHFEKAVQEKRITHRGV
ncbi:hypothetical protein QR680_009620 [Steinernema hermaphroditum]|uniref:Methylated-DNA--protein-cysteine methyltransferase n=1 Tax=Steinernema hermaphroditum TaxID=289476 RepID=A0AA39IN17_9BILA|nr:hypothetical protein QR680_009620 [Steinernema hermaphroditum]